MPSEYGNLTMGELIEKLQAVYDSPLPEYVKDRDQRQVYFDWCDFRPGYTDSYRGYYDHIAIEPKPNRATYLKDFIKALRERIGTTMHGWKGGEYEVTPATPVWVAESGEPTGWGVADVQNTGHSAVMKTAYFRDY